MVVLGTLPKVEVSYGPPLGSVIVIETPPDTRSLLYLHPPPMHPRPGSVLVPLLYLVPSSVFIPPYAANPPDRPPSFVGRVVRPRRTGLRGRSSVLRSCFDTFIPRPKQDTEPHPVVWELPYIPILDPLDFTLLSIF